MASQKLGLPTTRFFIHNNHGHAVTGSSAGAKNKPQNLVLAPQLRQSLKILQVPALELRSAILEELQTNPLLEEIGTNDESLESEEVEPSDELELEKGEDFS